MAQAALRRWPGVERVLTGAELTRERAAGAHIALELSFYPGGAGTCIYFLAPYLLPGPEPTGTTHGSPRGVRHARSAALVG